MSSLMTAPGVNPLKDSDGLAEGGTEPRNAQSRRAKITVDNVTIQYFSEERKTSHVAVRELSLEVFENEFLCVVGPSGCGKSTLISAIAGFIRPVLGQLTIDGRPIKEPGADRGVVFQEYALLPWKRVIDNVALGLQLRGMSKDERYEIANRFLDMTNLTEVARKFPHELSGGMKQRVAVARTLANSPDVMLMDEPFAAVDAQTRMTLQEELVRLWTQSTLTVVFVTHSVEEAVFLSDRIIVLDTNPGPVKATLDNRIDRNLRTWAQLNSNPDFMALRDEVLQLVRGTTPDTSK